MSQNPRQRLSVVEADITTLDVDTIVNAANRELVPGGGVDCAIHRAAGPELAACCRKLGGCPTGEARIAPGFKLKARHVVLTVGPVWSGGGADEDALLASCYRNSLRLAAESDCTSVAFPAISTGIYGFPPERAANIAVRTVVETSAMTPAITAVVFCCFSRASTELHERALATRWG